MNAHTLRLLFPQWQGGESRNIANYVHELAPEDAAQGYYLGGQLLAWLAPAVDCISATVPVSLDAAPEHTATENGVFAYTAVKRQLRAALDIIAVHNPEKIVTLGGECSVSVAPFAYLAARYRDDVAVIWLDAHPDLTMPEDAYDGFHAMALAAVLGKGDAALMSMLPAAVAPEKTLIVGLRSFDEEAAARQQTLGIASLSAEAVNGSSEPVLEWLRQSGTNKVMVHLDLDVLEPNDLRTAVAYDPNGLHLEATVRLINDIANACKLVGLTVAEPMPREVIKLRNLLHALPLLR